MRSRFLAPDEIFAIFSKLPRERRLIFEVALGTGLRIGDVLKIKKRDIRAAPEGRCEISFIAEKTGKAGITYIDGAAAKALLKLPKGNKGYLWGSYSKCGHITRQAAWKWFKTAAKEADVDISGVSPHSLRKSFASALRHREGLQAAQAALQHENSAVTAIYAYADAYAGRDPTEPVRWCQVDVLCDIIIERLNHVKQD